MINPLNKSKMRLPVKQYNELLKGQFNNQQKNEIIMTVSNGLQLWNDSEMIEYGEIRNQKLNDIISNALTKRGYLLCNEEIENVKKFLTILPKTLTKL